MTSSNMTHPGPQAGVLLMPGKGTIHIVAEASTTRAELARATFALGYHAEIYGDYRELVEAKLNHGTILAEDIAPQGGVVALIEDMARAGQWRPVIATASAVELRRVVDAVRRGAVDYLAPAIEAATLEAALDQASRDIDTKGDVHKEAVEAQGRLSKLSGRELEVLDHIVKGMSNKAIAIALHLSPRTVEIHRANMMTKLGANHPAEAIRCRLAAGEEYGNSARRTA